MTSFDFCAVDEPALILAKGGFLVSKDFIITGKAGDLLSLNFN